MEERWGIGAFHDKYICDKKVTQTQGNASDMTTKTDTESKDTKEVKTCSCDQPLRTLLLSLAVVDNVVGDNKLASFNARMKNLNVDSMLCSE